MQVLEQHEEDQGKCGPTDECSRCQRTWKRLHLFAFVLIGEVVVQESQVPKTREKLWSSEVLSLVKEDHVRENLNKLDIDKDSETDRMYAVVREMTDIIARPL